MENNRAKVWGLAFCLAAFFVGGWLLGRMSQRGEVPSLYQKDGASVGIFDNVPAQDRQAAAAVAAQALEQEIVLPEDQSSPRQDGRQLPSQIALTDVSEIAGVAPKEEAEVSAGPSVPAEPAALDLQLSGREVASVVPVAALPKAESQDDLQSQITLIAAPVKYFLIQNEEEYKAFKTKARGGYPEVDFSKQMLVVLESDSNLPDNVFELISAEEKEGELRVSYRVNIFRLDKKINSHTVLAVDKSKAPVQLKQVL